MVSRTPSTYDPCSESRFHLSESVSGVSETYTDVFVKGRRCLLVPPGYDVSGLHPQRERCVMCVQEKLVVHYQRSSKPGRTSKFGIEVVFPEK